MLGHKILIPTLRISHRYIATTCCVHSQINKQVHMMKKIMAGREKGKR